MKRRTRTTAFLALGDSEGGISIWKTNTEGRAIKYIKASSEELTIETLSWSKDGTMLFAATTKRIVIAIRFDLSMFGKVLSSQQKQDVLSEKYGTTQFGTPQENTSLTFVEMRLKMTAEAQVGPVQSQEMQPVTTPEPTANGTCSQPGPQKPTILKMQKSKDGKKKYTLVPKAKEPVATMELESAKFSTLDNRPTQKSPALPTAVATTTITQGSTEKQSKSRDEDKMLTENDNSKEPSDRSEGGAEVKPVKPKKVRLARAPSIEKKAPEPEKILEKPAAIEKYYQIKLKDRVLEIDAQKNMVDDSEEKATLVRCVGISTKNIKHILWTDFIEGKILLYQTNSRLICYYTDAHYLYINSLSNGRKYELPIVVPNLVMLKLNEKNDLMMLREDGHLKVYNIDSHVSSLEENVSSIVKEYADASRSTIESAHLDEEGTPYLYIRSNQVVMYNRELQGWQKVNQMILGLGIFKNPSTSERG